MLLYSLEKGARTFLQTRVAIKNYPEWRASSFKHKSNRLLLFLALALVVALVPYMCVHASPTEWENQLLYNNNTNFGSTTWDAATFTVGSTPHTVSSVFLALFAINSPTGTITVGIRATSGGVPVGDDLTSGTLSASSLSSYPPSWCEITMSTEYLLSPNTMYAIVARDNDTVFPNIIGQMFQSPSSYQGSTECYSGDSGSTWSSFSGNVFAFQVWGASPDVAVTNVASSKTVVGQGFSADVNVTVANQDDLTETFNVTLYANSTVIGTQQVSNLNASDQMTLTYMWDTTGLAYGNYTLSAYAEPVPGETNVANNNRTGGVVAVTIPGDVDGNFKIDMSDITLLLQAFGSKAGHPRFDVNADVDNNLQIDLSDIVTALVHFGQHYP